MQIRFREIQNLEWSRTKWFPFEVLNWHVQCLNYILQMSEVEYMQWVSCTWYRASYSHEKRAQPNMIRNIIVHVGGMLYVVKPWKQFVLDILFTGVHPILQLNWPHYMVSSPWQSTYSIYIIFNLMVLYNNSLSWIMMTSF